MLEEKPEGRENETVILAFFRRIGGGSFETS